MADVSTDDNVPLLSESESAANLPSTTERTHTSTKHKKNLSQTSSTSTLPPAFEHVNDAFSALIKSVQARLSGHVLGLPTAFFIMISMSYGSAVIIVPYTMRQLGVIVWILFTIACVLILAFSSVLLKEACVAKLIQSKTDKKEKTNKEDYAIIIQQPYQRVAEIVIGKRFSMLIQLTLYIALMCEVLAFMLLAATTMNRVAALWMTYYNRVRAWLLISYVIVMPFFMIGTYSDLMTPAFVAVSTSVIASVCIMIVSLVIRFHYGEKTAEYEVADTGSNEHIVKMFGEIMFAAAGPGILIPNIVVLVKKPEQFHKPILLTYALIFLIYTVLGFIPYYIFGQNVGSSVIETLHVSIDKFHMSPVWLSVVTIAEVVLSLHFVMVSVLSANPIFLSLENALKIPTEFSWKRLLLRGSFALTMLVISVAIPYFEPVISIIGALPLSLLCIIYPIIIYWYSFETTIWMKLLLSLIVAVTCVFMAGNVIFSIYDIVVNFIPEASYKHL